MSPEWWHAPGGWKHNVSIQVLWDLMTVARQPGETVASALKASHIHEMATFMRSHSVQKFTIIQCKMLKGLEISHYNFGPKILYDTNVIKVYKIKI